MKMSLLRRVGLLALLAFLLAPAAFVDATCGYCYGSHTCLSNTTFQLCFNSKLVRCTCNCSYCQSLTTTLHHQQKLQVRIIASHVRMISQFARNTAIFVWKGMFRQPVVILRSVISAEMGKSMPAPPSPPLAVAMAVN